MLTGQMIHDTWASLDPPSLAWESVQQKTRDTYNAVAERLNAQLATASEAEKKIDFSPEMVQLLLDEAMVKGIEKLLLHPEQEYTEEMVVGYLIDTLNLVSDVLPEEMRLSVRRILALYKHFLEEH